MSTESAVNSYYSDLFCSPNCDKIEDRVCDIVENDWHCEPETIGGQGAAGLADTIRFFSEFAPDLSYEPQEIISSDDGKVVVRSVVSGTPTKTFLGVEPTGKSFRIQAIDIHTLGPSGKIVSTNRTEDWARAIRQLS